MLEVVYNTLSFSTEFIIVSAVNQLLIQMQSVKADNLLICFYNWASIVHPFVNNFFLYFSFYGRKRFIRFHPPVFSNSHDYQLILALNETLFSNIAGSKILPTIILWNQDQVIIAILEWYFRLIMKLWTLFQYIVRNFYHFSTYSITSGIWK